MLGVGDLNGDGYQDLIASGLGGLRDELTNISADQEGTVYVIHGQTGEVIWETSGTGAFGASLALGDFNRDGTLELAVGAPRQETQNGQGVVQLIAYQGETVATLSSAGRRNAGLGTSLLTLETANETRLVLGEPRYQTRNNSPRIGRLRYLCLLYTSPSPRD